MLRGYDFLVNICEVKLQRIKNDIEQIKEKLYNAPTCQDNFLAFLS